MAWSRFAGIVAMVCAACSSAETSGTHDAGTHDAGSGGTSSDAGGGGGTSDAGGGGGTSDAGSGGGTSDAGDPDAGGDAASDAATPTLGVVTATELHAELASKDFLMIDVHVPHAGVIPGTDTSIPYTDVDGLAAYIGADLDKKVVLTCLTDHMSQIAGTALCARGYRAVRHLQGGMNAWVAAGYTLDP